MTQEEIKEKYFLIEITEETEKTKDFTGWRVIAMVDCNNFTSVSPEFRTDPEAWPINFQLIYKAGMLLASPECPEQYYLDSEELKELAEEMSKSYVTYSLGIEDLSLSWKDKLTSIDTNDFNKIIYDPNTWMVQPYIGDPLGSTSTITCSSTNTVNVIPTALQGTTSVSSSTVNSKLNHYNTYASSNISGV